MKCYLPLISSLFFISNVSFAQETLVVKQDLGVRDTILSAVLVQNEEVSTSFNLLKQYVIDSNDVTLSQHYGWTPNNTYDCGNFHCLTATVTKSALKSVMSMDFIKTQPYAMLENFKLLHGSITEPTSAIVDIVELDGSYRFYVPSPYGFGTSDVTFIPVNGRDK